MNQANMPAFPILREQWNDHQGGLSKRELFAAMAMQGLLANPGGPIQANGMNGWALCNCTEDDVAGTSLSLADALIAALNEEPTP